MGKIKWSLRAAIEQFREGETDTTKIAESVGMSSSELRRALKRRGYQIAPVPAGRKHRPEIWDQIAALYVAGMGPNRIGRKVGLHHTSVSYAIKRMAEQRGLTRTATPQVQAVKDVAISLESQRRRDGLGQRNQRIAHLYCGGESSLSIGRALCLDSSTVRRALKQMGIPRRTATGAKELADKKAAARREAQRKLAEKLEKDKLLALSIDRMWHLARPARKRTAA